MPKHTRRRRERLGISQTALAGKIGVSRSALNRWELGNRQPDSLWQQRWNAVLRRLELARERSRA